MRELHDQPTNNNHPRLTLQVGSNNHPNGMRVFEAKYIGWVEVDDEILYLAVYPDGICSYRSQFGGGGLSRVDEAIPFGFASSIAASFGIEVKREYVAMSLLLDDLWSDIHLPDGAVIVAG